MAQMMIKSPGIARPMILLFETTAPDETLTLPLENQVGGIEVSGVLDYNFLVDWGDGSSDAITAWDQAEKVHTYSVPGQYTVTITGQCGTLYFYYQDSAYQLRELQQWGNVGLQSMYEMFAGCEYMTVTATDVPIWPPDGLGSAGWDKFKIAYLFEGCYLMTTCGASKWDVSSLTGLVGIFYYAESFNEDISGWDTSSCTDMSGLFQGALLFNQEIGGWNVGNVTNMGSLFRGAESFNGDISAWNTSKVTNMSSMFGAFSGQTASFNQDIGGWDVGNVTSMSFMFSRNQVFNQDLNDWDVSNLIEMNGMFSYCTAFNSKLDKWVTSSVTTMNGVFYNNSAFNQDVSSWDVSNITDASNFATIFSESYDSGFSASMYSRLLEGWAAQTLQPNVYFSVEAKYWLDKQADRDILTNAPNNWTVVDGGTTATPVAANLIWDNDSTVIRGRYNHTTDVFNRGEIGSDDFGEGGGEALFQIGSAISGLPFRNLYYPWADAEPVDMSLYWVRYVQPSSGVEVSVLVYNGGASVPIIWDTPQRMDGVKATTPRQDYLNFNTPIYGYNFMECASSQFFIDICEADSNGDPDGNWQRREIRLLSTGSGAFEDLMFWGGSTLVAEDISSSPQPTIEFKSDGLAHYSDGGGTSTTPWHDGGGLSNGRWEIGQWGTASGNPPTGGDISDVIIEDALANTYSMNNTNYDDEHEALGAKVYLDFSGDPVGTVKEASFYVYVMDNTNNWRQVSRLVTLRGEKTA
jgi:surface protein